MQPGLADQYRKDIDRLRWIPWRATEVVWPCKGEPDGPGFIQPGKEAVAGAPNSTAVPMGGFGKDGARSFTEEYGGKGHKLKQRKFYLGVWKEIALWGEPSIWSGCSERPSSL